MATEAKNAPSTRKGKAKSETFAVVCIAPELAPSILEAAQKMKAPNIKALSQVALGKGFSGKGCTYSISSVFRGDFDFECAEGD